LSAKPPPVAEAQATLLTGKRTGVDEPPTGKGPQLGFKDRKVWEGTPHWAHDAY